MFCIIGAMYEQLPNEVGKDEWRQGHHKMQATNTVINCRKSIV